jgi:DNA-binding NarL/FixJ family response regulator
MLSTTDGYQSKSISEAIARLGESARLEKITRFCAKSQNYRRWDYLNLLHSLYEQKMVMCSTKSVLEEKYMETVGFSSKQNLAQFKLDIQTSSALEHLLQTQWIRPEVSISIMSSSHLLREALFHRLNADFQVAPVGSSQGWLLLDYGIGQDFVVKAIQDWRIQYPHHYLMVMELPNDPEVILDCVSAGAHAYMLRGASGTAMIETMQQVDRGLFQCPLAITNQLLSRLSQSQTRSRPDSLTQREWDVLRCIGRGMSDRAIAAELYISLRTVKHHVHNLLGKLQVQSRWQAAQLAQENGWLAGDRSC